MARPLSATSSVSGPPHQIAAVLLFAGGTLAFIASFLPLGQIAYPAVADEPATTFVEIPSQTLVLFAQQTIQTPYRLSIESCLMFAGFWAAPLSLAAISVALLVRRRRARARLVSGMLLIVLGAGVTILYCALYLFFAHGEVIQPKATLGYGPAVALSGYFLALVGVIWLTFQRSRRARAEGGPPYR